MVVRLTVVVAMIVIATTAMMVMKSTLIPMLAATVLTLIMASKARSNVFRCIASL